MFSNPGLLLAHACATTAMSLNRREVRCCSVQLGAFSELEILAAMVRAYQKPVQLTFNSLLSHA